MIAIMCLKTLFKIHFFNFFLHNRYITWIFAPTNQNLFFKNKITPKTYNNLLNDYNYLFKMNFLNL